MGRFPVASRTSIPIKREVVATDTGEVFELEFLDGDPNYGPVHRNLRASTRCTKTDFKKIERLKLSRPTRDFLFNIITHMTRVGEVRGLNQKYPRNQKELGDYFGLPRSTVNTLVKPLLDSGVIRQYRRKAYFVSPAYAYKFRRDEIPPIVVEVFPELISYGQRRP